MGKLKNWLDHGGNFSACPVGVLRVAQSHYNLPECLRYHYFFTCSKNFVIRFDPNF